ncbi:MAG: hypothetical protein JF615_15445 [Asticcacaulis sp.]|nr:hypothetical protein [Asticcacaulis sp.]
MGSFKNPAVIDAQFVELPVLDTEFDYESEAKETLVVYDAFGGIRHTVSPGSEAQYE